MAELHMTEREVADDFEAVLDKVRTGVEIVIERDSEPIVAITAPVFRGRALDECIASAKSRGFRGTLDSEFSRDLEKIIEERRAPFKPSSD